MDCSRIHGRAGRCGVLLLALLLAACTTVINPVSGQREISVMNESAEIAEGRKAHAEVLKESTPVADAGLQTYVDGIGQKLARGSQRPHLPWTFTVLDSPEVNAFALPGGYVYITRGILAYLESEADLAGVIGHEIGHVSARHGAQRATRQQAAGLGVLAVGLLGVVADAYGLGGVGQLAGQAAQGAAAGYIASYSREQELQADRLGAEYLARNHYDPKNMVDVIAVLKMQEQFAADQARAAGRPSRSGGDWLASHPSNEQRLQSIREIAAAQAAQTRGEGFAEDGRARYLAAIDGLVFGDSPAQGLVRGQSFVHPELGLALSAPAGWRIRNGADAVLLLNAAGDAGVSLRPVPPKAGETHEQMLRTMLTPIQGRADRFKLNGFDATHFSGQGRNAQGQPQAVEATVVSGPKGANYLMLYAARDAAARQRAQDPWREIEASFRAMNAADRQAARAWVVHQVPMPEGGFAELARQSALSAESAEPQLRLLNGVYGSADPKPGHMVKTIVRAER
ncbi:MAG: hypothetical protein RLZZ598_1018 [Pseudomonadota bacterium]|jgi:predicted Zn-dependent protease